MLRLKLEFSVRNMSHGVFPSRRWMMSPHRKTDACQVNEQSLIDLYLEDNA